MRLYDTTTAPSEGKEGRLGARTLPGVRPGTTVTVHLGEDAIVRCLVVIIRSSRCHLVLHCVRNGGEQFVVDAVRAPEIGAEACSQLEEQKRVKRGRACVACCGAVKGAGRW